MTIDHSRVRLNEFNLPFGWRTELASDEPDKKEPAEEEKEKEKEKLLQEQKTP